MQMQCTTQYTREILQSLSSGSPADHLLLNRQQARHPKMVYVPDAKPR